MIATGKNVLMQGLSLTYCGCLLCLLGPAKFPAVCLRPNAHQQHFAQVQHLTDSQDMFSVKHEQQSHVCRGDVYRGDDAVTHGSMTHIISLYIMLCKQCKGRYGSLAVPLCCAANV
jgi:hypothetical protein